MYYNIKIYEIDDRGRKECETIRGLTYGQMYAIKSVLDRKRIDYKTIPLDADDKIGFRPIGNFEQIKAYHHGENWHIIDCTPGCGDPFKNAIGGHFQSYMALCLYAELNYDTVYK